MSIFLHTFMPVLEGRRIMVGLVCIRDLCTIMVMRMPIVLPMDSLMVRDVALVVDVVVPVEIGDVVRVLLSLRKISISKRCVLSWRQLRFLMTRYLPWLYAMTRPSRSSMSLCPRRKCAMIGMRRNAVLLIWRLLGRLGCVRCTIADVTVDVVGSEVVGVDVAVVVAMLVVATLVVVTVVAVTVVAVIQEGIALVARVIATGCSGVSSRVPLPLPLPMTDENSCYS